MYAVTRLTLFPDTKSYCNTCFIYTDPWLLLDLAHTRIILWGLQHCEEFLALWVIGEDYF